MIKRILVVVVIVAIAGFVAYRLGLFDKKTETTIERTLDEAGNKARDSVDKIKNLLGDE